MEQQDTLAKFYITFPWDHRWGKGYKVIYAKDIGDANDRAFDMYGAEGFSQVREEADKQYFPEGEIK